MVIQNKLKCSLWRLRFSSNVSIKNWKVGCLATHFQKTCKVWQDFEKSFRNSESFWIYFSWYVALFYTVLCNLPCCVTSKLCDSTTEWQVVVIYWFSEEIEICRIDIGTSHVSSLETFPLSQNTSTSVRKESLVVTFALWGADWDDRCDLEEPGTSSTASHPKYVSSLWRTKSMSSCF